MKFRVKVTVVVISLLSILFGVGGTALINTTFRGSIQREQVTAEKAYNMMFNTIVMVSEASDWSSEEEISDAIKKITAQEEMFCSTRLSSADEIIYREGQVANEMADNRQKVEPGYVICQVFKGQSGYYFQQTGCFVVGDKKMYLDTAYSISDIYAMREEQRRTYLSIFGVLVALSALLSYILAYLLTRPMVKLKNVATRITEGELELRSNIKSTDEIGALSREFDRMTDSLVDQMERQNQFIGNFTHEIKTPMTSIIGYAELMRGGTLDKEDQVEAANYIFSEGKRLERLSVKMLELLVAGNDSLELTPQQPAELIRKITDNLADEYREQSIELECSLQTGSCLLEPDLFTSLIVNLLENARRAIVSMGAVESRADADKASCKKGKIKVSCSMTETGCSLTISDNGCGIPEESLTHIKEAFYRVDKARSRAMGGAGLGLSLCDRIVKLHRGAMDIESVLGEGTTIAIDLKGGREGGAA